MEDQAIIALFEARSPEAIVQTKCKYSSLCRSIAVEECVNDTYLALWNAIPPAKPAPLSAYIAKITRNLALKRLEQLSADKRSAESLLSFDELDACLAATEDIEAAIDEIVLRESITAFLQSQSRESRLIFLRRYFFFDSVKEIAQNYRLSESKVKSSLMRTRNKLRAYLIQEGFIL